MANELTSAIAWDAAANPANESPLETVFDHLVVMLIELINVGERDSSVAQLTTRHRACNALNHLIVTCTSMRDRALQHEALHPVLFYERVRLGCTSSGYFLEGCPAKLNMFSGSCTVHVPDEDIVRLRLRDVLGDRLATIAKVESMGQHSSKRSRVVSNHKIEDLPTAVPGVVCVFISRMRAICQGLQRVKPQNVFHQCDNCECNRLFYVGQPFEVAQASSAAAPWSRGLYENEWNSDDEPDDYWQLAQGDKQQTRTAYNRRFCSVICRYQWHAQIKNALPQTGDIVLAADDKCRRQGRSRVTEAFRLVMKRNEAAYRAMRQSAKVHHKYPAVHKVDLKRFVNRRVRMLNVDAGLLYAASIIAESAQLSNNKVLPGSRSGWRHNPIYYRRVMRIVSNEYEKCNHTDVLSNPLLNPKFFKILKRRAPTLF
tara:strand:- start:9461 stop:10747 length:1287 start_codon:yes stop_codon:yes gene_type:complete